MLHCIRGLSPPTRGSLTGPKWRPTGSRSIPAHAGKPLGEEKRPDEVAVYPRPRGEALNDPPTALEHLGLSPPTRGSRSGVETGLRLLRSIPAHAGKPPPHGVGLMPSGVYPRPRGEAKSKTLPVSHESGLSPPTREAAQLIALPARQCGLSPPHAGKPEGVGRHGGSPGVYPRPRGEAAELGASRNRHQGLSPPTRGSPGPSPDPADTDGSIPAHAGKPNPTIAELRRRYGLSPPTRGSR